MNDFMFSIPQTIQFGKGSIQSLPECIRKLGGEKILLISDRGLERAGAVDRVKNILDKEGLPHCEFLDVLPNPTIETVNEAVVAFTESKADVIVALGGGSPMDVAKAVAVLAKHGGSITDYEGAHKVPGKIIPMIAIPTTAGTGSEVTAFAVITDTSRNYKLTVFSYELIPTYALLDLELIVSLPATIASSTGMDALTHAIEAYLSKAASPFSDAMAEKAMQLIGRNIRRFVADRSDEEAAGNMMMASTFAGIAFAWARLGNVHAMAHPLGGFYNVPHGIANAILLPHVLEYNALSDFGKYEKMYHSLKGKRVEAFDPMMLVSEIRKMLQDLGIPENLSMVGVTKEYISEMAEDAMKSGNIAVNPRQSTKQDLEVLYQKAL